MLLFNRLRKKVKREFFEKKIDFELRIAVTTLARYSRYIFCEEICSTKHDYLHARRLDRRAVLDMLASELDMLDSEQGEQSSTCSTASRTSRASKEESHLVYRSPNMTFL